MDQQIAPASITKLFTAYVALLYLPTDQVLTAGREVRLVDIHSSFAYVKEGDQLTVEQCVQGMIIPSGNDASYVLAVNAGRAIANDATLSIADACTVFMDEVNRQAKLLGLNNTHFVNPDGNHAEDHYTSLRDLLRIAQLSLATPVIRQAAQIQKMQATFLNDRQEDWDNSNLLLDPTSQYYLADAIGLKTGSTNAAGKCLLSAFERDGNVYIVCVMGCSTSGKRYADTLALYNAFVNT